MEIANGSKSNVVPAIIRITLFLLGIVLFSYSPANYKTEMLISFFVIMIGTTIYHLSFGIFVVRKKEYQLPLLISLIDIALFLLIISPLLIFIDKNVNGDFDILPQLIIFWIGYSFIVRQHIEPKLGWWLSVINGVNIGLSISLIWIISLFYIINVKSNGPSLLTIVTVLISLILTPLLAIKLYFFDNNYLKKSIVLLSFMVLVLLFLIFTH